MKKGFTLVEIMGVITILAIVLVIAVPGIVNTIRKVDLDKEERIKKDIFLATESYIQREKEKVSFIGVTACININILIDEEYLSYNNIKDIDNIKEKSIKIIKENDIYKYELLDTKCEDKL